MRTCFSRPFPSQQGCAPRESDNGAIIVNKSSVNLSSSTEFEMRVVVVKEEEVKEEETDEGVEGEGG